METRKVKSHLSHGIEKTEEKARYDEGAKELLSDKQVLARIAKYRIKEFEDYDIPTIMECIEGEPEISVVPVYPGKKKPEVIIGMYSIWIFFEAPEKDSDTITEYSLTKKEMLEQKHQMHMTRELEGGITSMCNLSEGLWERALEEGMEKGIEKGVIALIKLKYTL